MSKEKSAYCGLQYARGYQNSHALAIRGKSPRAFHRASSSTTIRAAPSDEDIRATQNLVKASQLIELLIFDHIIPSTGSGHRIGDGCYTSLKEEPSIPYPGG